MKIYHILLDEILENDGETITLNRLAQYQKRHYPNEPLSIPKLHPVKQALPDDLVEIDAVNREISKGDDVKVRGKGW